MYIYVCLLIYIDNEMNVDVLFDFFLVICLIEMMIQNLVFCYECFVYIYNIYKCMDYVLYIEIRR